MVAVRDFSGLVSLRLGLGERGGNRPDRLAEMRCVVLRRREEIEADRARL